MKIIISFRNRVYTSLHSFTKFPLATLPRSTKRFEYSTLEELYSRAGRLDQVYSPIIKLSVKQRNRDLKWSLNRKPLSIPRRISDAISDALETKIPPM